MTLAPAAIWDWPSDSNEQAAVVFLLYLFVPVLVYLLGALGIWLWRRVFRRGAKPADGEGAA